MDASFFNVTNFNEAYGTAYKLFVSNISEISEGKSLTVRCGSEKTGITFGNSNNYDVLITNKLEILLLRINSALSRMLTNCRFHYSSSKRCIYCIPPENTFFHISFPIKGVFEYEEIKIKKTESIGDLSIENGDIKPVALVKYRDQNLIMRCISDSKSGSGFQYAPNFGSGWQDYIGKPTNEDNLNSIGRKMQSACSADGRFTVSKVLAFPLNNGESIQPVIIQGELSFPLPIKISMKGDTITTS